MPAKSSKTKENPKNEKLVTKRSGESDDKTKGYLLLANATIGNFLILINQNHRRRIILPGGSPVKY